MNYLTQQQFENYARAGYRRIPLSMELLADFETPLSVHQKLAAARPFGYLLESVQGGERWGRYSIIGLPCRARIEVRGQSIREIADGEVRERECADPLNEIRNFLRDRRVLHVDGLPRFCGGLVGFFGYDTVRYIEPHLGAHQTPDPIGAPDILLLVSDEVAVFDNLSGRLSLIIHTDATAKNAYARGRERLQEIAAQLSQPLPRGESAAGNFDAGLHTELNEDKLQSSFPRAEFETAVEKIRAYIHAGDAYQVALSQRLAMPYAGAPLDVYRALRTINPSPYMYYLDCGEFQIAGASPEILARLEHGEVTLRPIAGTRPRGANKKQDEELAAELLTDEKELAEHLMLIDLGRNDVGRVARIGTVAVTEQMIIEKYSHVMHIVSEVRGALADGLDALDVLRATFPAGTLSGAPKVRALEIIEELEPDKRGVYSGAIGYIGWNGNMDTAIAIRTALIKSGMVYAQAGAGIVADSEPAREWLETMNKGRAVFRAVAMARAGLR